MKLIVSATDGSEGAERAVKVAAELAERLNATLLLVHVGEDVFSSDQLLMLDQIRITEGDALEQVSRRFLASAKGIAQHLGVSNIRTIIGGGDPAKVLIDIIVRERADAIVVGRRGRGQLQGLLLGSVSQKLSCLAPCVVMVVP
ncbi:MULTISPECIES: universal stress protein [unclassified Bradyrhizobium]|nr:MULTISPECIES: universal stress protein [unclassified Bradyrhizobium]